LLNPPASTTNVNALRPYSLAMPTSVCAVSRDTSNYNSLQVSASRRTQKGLAFGVSYTFSKTIDATSGSPQDAYNPKVDHGLSSIHRGSSF